MAKRKAISKKLRFEVFKRDKFTCQYCGESAPDVILEVDHIKPVAKGGTNDIMNLITSCRDCNRGKSDKEISDDSVIKKQQKQIEELAERREQLEMMLKWRDSMHDLKEVCIDKVCEVFQDNTNYEVSKDGRRKIKKWLDEFSLDEVLDAVEIAIDRYFEGDKYTLGLACSKVAGICHNRRIQETDMHSYYMNYTVKVMRINGWQYNKEIIRDLIYSDINSDEDFELLKKCIRSARSWGNFLWHIVHEFDNRKKS